MEEQRKFYEIVETNLKNNVSSIKNAAVFNSLDDSKQYMLLGSLAYITGIGLLEFHKSPNVVEDINKTMVNAFNERLQRIGVELNDVSHLFEVFKESRLFTDKELLSKINQENKELLNEQINIKSFEMRLNSVVNTTITPIGFADDVKRLLNAGKEFTYRDILLLNRYLFNDEVSISGYKMYNVYQKLQQSEDYNKYLEEARERFEIQKYSVMNFDLIITLIEFFNHWENQTFDKILSHIYHYEIETNKSDERFNDIQNTNETEDIQSIFENQPLKSVYISLRNNKETSTTNINSVNDLISEFKIYVEKISDEDLESIIAYIRNMNVKRSEIPFNFDGFNINSEDFKIFKDFINEQFTENSSLYKKEYEKYLADIPSLHLERIKPLIFDLLSNILATTSEEKIFVYNQMLENNITTYHHLNEFLTVIENCKIEASNINKYLALKDYLLENTEINVLFKNVNNIRKLNNVSYFYQCLKNSI